MGRMMQGSGPRGRRPQGEVNDREQEASGPSQWLSPMEARRIVGSGWWLASMETWRFVGESWWGLGKGIGPPAGSGPGEESLVDLGNFVRPLTGTLAVVGAFMVL